MATLNLRQPSLVGLIGLKRSGKDTAARALVDQLGWHRMAFADPLKDMSLHLRGVWVEVPHRARMASTVPLRQFEPYHRVIESLSMDRAKELVSDVRTILQTLGTDCVRGTFGTHAWTDLIGTRVSDRLNAGERVVITDVRFAEEMNLVRELGGMTVGIWRGAIADLDHILQARSSAASSARNNNDAHSSEITVYELLPQADHVVANNGSIRDLQRTVVGLVMGF